VDGMIRKNKSEISFHENEIEALRKKIESLSWLKLAEDRFELLKSAYERCFELKHEITELTYFLDKFESIKEDFFDYEKAQISLDEILLISKNKNELNKNIQELQSLMRLYHSYVEEEIKLKTEISFLENELNSFSICPLCGSEL
jgi:uncharacterized membrane protein YgaE (UPF0421/DUF939 family)